MSYIVVKTIRGRRYYYSQESYRAGGKVRTRSIYLGPVDGSGRKKAADEKFRQVLRDNVFQYGKSRPGARYASEARARAEYHHDMGFKGAPEPPRTDEEIAQADQWSNLMDRARTDAKFPEHGRTPAKEAARERYMNLREQVQAEDARQTAQNAPGRTQEAPAKDFTVDDEIEAREAKFDAAVDEYNAGTTTTPDSPAPDDAPLPS